MQLFSDRNEMAKVAEFDVRYVCHIKQYDPGCRSDQFGRPVRSGIGLMRCGMRRICFLAVVCCALGTAGPIEAGGIEVRRNDFKVASDAGITLAVREVASSDAAPAGLPLILVHGARVPGIASFDLDAPHGSLAADFAAAGLDVFIMDVRGYGGSTRTGQEGDPAGRPPLVRSGEVVRDIAAVVQDVQRRTGAHQVALLGWATGGHWAGMFASLHPDAVSHLVILNSLYGGHVGHPTLGPGGPLTDSADPSRLDGTKVGAFGFSTAASLTPSWDASIPLADKPAWRDPAVLRAYQAAALASDPTSAQREPPSFRAPMGAIADSFELASGRKLWNASAITARVLVLRSDHDFWSRPEDLENLRRDLTQARSVKAETLQGATHYVHLDRPERGRDRLLSDAIAFLRDRS
ncbi:alpha/beta fold hydrolase [Bradyrhizobium sp. SZCCHNPS2010]|uniref:alpha/beta fold hydrolase n=1 Tax=Bradyrhizobium sp. SZCCHNPS2010 TaxID=3057333 RepID=UPI002916344C|nr:alpha/beta fold hydrolase [Bradyrhizobium sp. SZCCHNPS2010]